MTDQSPDAFAVVPECFVIMPITDGSAYTPGHFQNVFDSLFKPACEAAGYVAVRADQRYGSDLIHLDILRRLLETPMAICDLSSRNPNVLFELGLRQAFDKPVLLVQEEGTPQTFDINPWRITNYRQSLRYLDVVEDQRKIIKGLQETEAMHNSGEAINSIVRLLSLIKAPSLSERTEADQNPLLQIVLAEINELRKDITETTRDRWPELQAKLKQAEVMVNDAKSAFHDRTDILATIQAAEPNVLEFKGLAPKVRSSQSQMQQMIDALDRIIGSITALCERFGRSIGGPPSSMDARGQDKDPT